MKTFDPKLHVVTWGPYLLDGFGKGTFIKAAREEQAFTREVGADGETSRSRSRNRGGTVELTLMQSSQSNDALSLEMHNDELAGTGVHPLLVKDLLGTTVIFSGNAWLQKPADAERAKQLGENTWTFDCDVLEMFVGGSLP